jgi:hypothetical protein
MTVPESRPLLFRLNPGSVPEAGQLAAVSRGLAGVRSLIVRETTGAVSPRMQLLAVDALLQRHHDAIASVVQASVTRNDRVLAPADALQLTQSLIEHVTTASYWLQLARDFRKLPTENVQHDLSVVKSRERREHVLKVIQSNCQTAVELMTELALLAPNNEEVVRQLDSYNLAMVCVQINATVSARTSASGGPTLSSQQLTAWLRELSRLRTLPPFGARSLADQNLLWQATSVVAAELGDRQMVRTALRERQTLTSGDPDAHARLLVEMLDYFDTAEDHLALINDLRGLASVANLGPLFSRDRVGRMSVLRDAFWGPRLALILTSRSPRH